VNRWTTSPERQAGVRLGALAKLSMHSGEIGQFAGRLTGFN